MSVEVSITLSDEQLDLIAERAAELLAERQAPADESYLDVQGAAEFLVCSTSRIYSLVSAKRVPHYKDGSRTLFDRQELRQYVRGGGARRP